MDRARRLVPLATLSVVTGLASSLCLAGGLTLAEKTQSVVLDNPLATAEIDKHSGTVTRFHCGDGVNLVREIHIDGSMRIGSCDRFEIVHNQPSLVEVAFVFLRRLPDENDSSRGLHVELHYAMQPDTPGVYVYFVWTVVNDPAMRKRAALARTVPSKFRAVTLETPYYYVDQQRNGLYPMHGLEKKRTVYDATWIFTDGTIHSKYDDLSIQYREHLLGKFSDTHGIFFVVPSNEGAGGGPYKQRVCQQYDTLMFMHMLDGHCGLPQRMPEFTDGWRHVFGPWLIYINHADNRERILELAKAQAAHEIARWPYRWVTHPAYAAAARVSVSGRLRITDGTSPEGALVMLGDRGMHYQERVQNYLYYRQADKQGRFTIPGVRPGEYKLYVVADGAMGEYVRDAVTVPAGSSGSDLGEIAWTPETFGQTLWQIGTPDRTGEEFWMGKYHHQWGMHIIYPKFFPNDVDFYVGTSREERDWPYYQLTARTWDKIDHYNRGYHWDESIHRLRFDFTMDQPADPEDRTQFNPFTPAPYRIHFNLNQDYRGQATLSLAVAGTMFEGPTRVSVNGRDVTGDKPIRFADSSTLRRCTGIGAYSLVRVPFDAALLHRGENVLTLAGPQFTTRKGRLPKQSIGNVVYDCIRLEAMPTQGSSAKN